MDGGGWGSCVVGVVFFFKQKTAYEMLRSLVGSEMCIRDRLGGVRGFDRGSGHEADLGRGQKPRPGGVRVRPGPVSYTHLTLPTIYSV